MSLSRIQSDAILRPISKHLDRCSLSTLRQLAIELCDVGADIVSLNEPAAENVLVLLRTQSVIPPDYQAKLQVMANAADTEYLDLLDAEGANEECLRLFGKARMLCALTYAVINTKEAALDAIYESVIGTNRNAMMLEKIRAVAGTQ